MSIPVLTIAAVALLLSLPAHGEGAAPAFPVELGDVVYKGVVGKALDAVPMDPHERVTLQRTSAVVSGTLTGRSLAVWAGLSNPILLVAGVVWGIFSASNIKPRATGAQAEEPRIEPPAPAGAGPTQVAQLGSPWPDHEPEAVR